MFILLFQLSQSVDSHQWRVFNGCGLSFIRKIGNQKVYEIMYNIHHDYTWRVFTIPLGFEKIENHKKNNTSLLCTL